MSIQVLKQPGAISFSRNPVVFQFKTDAQIQTAGKKFTAKLPFDYNAPQSFTFTLAYSDLKLDFTVAPNPDDSGYQLPARQVPNASDYAEQLAAALNQNFYLNRDFVFGTANDGVNWWVTITARTEGVIYNLSITGTNWLSLQVQQAGVDTVLNANFKLYAEIWVKTANDADFSKISDAYLEVDADGLANMDISGQLTDTLLANGFDRPDFVNAIAKLDKTVCQYFIKYAEVYGTTQVIRQLKTTGSYFAMLGGISKEMLSSIQLPDSFIANGKLKFLKQDNVEKYILPGQLEFLTVALLNAAYTAISMRFVITYSDETTATLSKYTFANLERYSRLTFPVGFVQNNLNLVDSSKIVLKYSVVLLDGNDAEISETRTYWINYDLKLYARQFVYLSSLGTYDTQVTFGQGSSQYDIVQSSAEIVTDKGFILADGEQINYSNSLTNSETVTSGYREKSEIRLFKDLALSIDLFVYRKKRVYPVAFTSKSIKEFKDAENLHAITFDYGFRFSEQMFTADPLDTDDDAPMFSPMSLLATMPPPSPDENFDDRYYKKVETYNNAQIDDALGNVQGAVQTVSQTLTDGFHAVNNELNDKAALIHEHDDRYMSRSDLDTTLFDLNVGILEQTVPRKTINQIRAIEGNLESNVYFTPDQGKYGYWLYDPTDNTSPDNLGTVLVTADGKRFKRSYTGGVIPQWFGYNPGMDDATAILQTIIDNFSSVLLQDGTYNINTLNVTSGKKIETTGYGVIIQQRPGQPVNTRIVNIKGSNISIGEISLRGNILTDTDEQNHGMFINADNSTGDIFNISILGLDVRGIRGDGFYIGGGFASNRPVPRNIWVGNYYGKDIYRNGAGITSGRNITFLNYHTEGCGLLGLDLEPNGNNLENVYFANVRTPRMLLLGTAQAITNNIRFGNVQLDWNGNANAPIPFPSSDATLKYCLTFRSVANVHFGNVIIKNAPRFAIGCVYNDQTDVINRGVTIDRLQIDNCATEAGATGLIDSSLWDGLKINSGRFALPAGSSLAHFTGRSNAKIYVHNVYFDGGRVTNSVNGDFINCKLVNGSTTAFTGLKDYSSIIGCDITSVNILGFSNNCYVLNNQLNYTGYLFNSANQHHFMMNNVENGVVRIIMPGTAAPTSGTWAIGDRVENTAPTATSPIGWVCVAAGTPGTWAAYGGNQLLNMDNTFIGVNTIAPVRNASGGIAKGLNITPNLIAQADNDVLVGMYVKSILNGNGKANVKSYDVQFYNGIQTNAGGAVANGTNIFGPARPNQTATNEFRGSTAVFNPASTVHDAQITFDPVTNAAQIGAYVSGVLEALTLLGVVNVTTPVASDNSKRIANTEWVRTLLGTLATLASPAFTGTPTAPTAAAGTNTTQIATTAFVAAAVPSTNGLAPLANPAFTGAPTAPTAPDGTNTTQIATTEFTNKAVSGKQNTITLTTTGTSGAATLVGSTLNIPQYPTVTQGFHTSEIKPTSNTVEVFIPQAQFSNAMNQVVLFVDLSNASQDIPITPFTSGPTIDGATLVVIKIDNSSRVITINNVVGDNAISGQNQWRKFVFRSANQKWYNC